MEQTNDIINIGVAQVRTGSKPAVLRTILGSCIGICIYDRIKKIGGLAHILLPTDASSSRKGNSPEKYADTAIPLLVERLIRDGAKKEYLSAKIAGGASMFKFDTNASLGLIGEKNVEETKKALGRIGIPILEQDTGGSAGRVLNFYLEDGRLKVKAAGKEKIYYKI